MTRPSHWSGHGRLPMLEWPVPDRDAWEAAVRVPGFLEEGGRGAGWRPVSRDSAVGTYGRWLGWLAGQGVDLDAETPAARFTRDRLGAYAEFIGVGRSSVTVASAIGVLCMAVVAMFPERDWTWMRRGQGRLKRRSKPARQKARRLVPADQLVGLGLDLIAAAGAVLDRPCDPVADRTARERAARDLRDGLMIGLLASRPLRVKNLLQIQIGTHVRHTAERATIQFTASETKEHRAYSAVWPDVLLPALTRYLKEVRPMLVVGMPFNHTARSPRPPGANLWLAQGGTPLSADALRQAIERHTLRRFGHALTPHLFRNCVASTASNEDPDHMNNAARLLNHATLRTTERHYIAPDGAVALDTYHALIAGMRGKEVRDR